MRTNETVTVPPVPEPPAGAGPLVLDLDDTHRILFNLAGRMPTDLQLYGMVQRIERTVAQYERRFGLRVRSVSWRWVS